MKLSEINQQIIACERCPRLVSWRQQVGDNPRASYKGQNYWAKPVPNFGDRNARLLIVGLAPGAHGANRTGRMFTGDRSGEWLYSALYKAGLASSPQSLSLDDGMELTNTYITAVAHCAPPQNRLQPQEVKNCGSFLESTFDALKEIKVILALGKLAFDQACDLVEIKPRAVFGHGAKVVSPSGIVLLGSYHPSQQNTFTGKLTEQMWQSVINQAADVAKGH